MKVTLQFRDQIVGFGGEMLAAEFEGALAKIQKAWDQEHTPDDKHGVVHATSYSERGRTTPLGEFIVPVFDATMFTSQAGAWTVTIGAVTNLSYTLIGNMMTLMVVITNTIVTAATANLKVKIPANKVCKSMVFNPVQTIDNGGAPAIGMAVGLPGATTILFQTPAGGGFANTGGVANTSVRGQISFEVLP